MRRVGLLIALCLVASCANREAQLEAKARAVTLPVVTRIVAQEYSGVPVTPIAECVVDNADDQETVELVSAGKEGISGRDTQTVVEIMNRPETRDCMSAAGVDLARV